VCGREILMEEKEELVDYIDRDKSKTIDFDEFSKIFELATDVKTIELKDKLNSRSNIMFCF